MEKKRILWIDIAKALGILVVLMVHTGKSFGLASFFGGMFYMPVFFVLAGMTFRCKNEESFGSFARKKARRLLVPYFGYSFFLFLVFFVKNDLLAGQVSGKSFFPLLGILYSRNCLFSAGTPDNLYFMQILNAPAWFLTCLFVSYLAFWLLMRAAKGELKKALYLDLFVLAVSVLVHYLCPVLLPWSIDCALYSVSFLLFGQLLSQKNLVEKLYGRPLPLLALAAAFAALSFANGSVNMSVADYGHSMILYLFVGGLGSLLAMELSVFLEKHTGPFGKACAFLGRHTLPVLCLHLLVYSVIGTVLGLLGLG